MSEIDTARDKSRATTDERTEIDDRTTRALEQFLTVLEDYGPAADTDGQYMVVSESGEEYLVDTRTETCECPDHEYRDVRCKHLRRVAIATGAEEIPAGVAPDAVDPQLGLHVTASPRQVATDGGVITANGGESDDTDEESDERPDDCDCAPFLADAGLPCWACYREGFDEPNPDVEQRAVGEGEGE